MARLKLWITFFLFFLSNQIIFSQVDFLEKQLSYTRVQTAYEKVYENLEQGFEDKAIVFPPKQIYMRGFKAEGLLEIWVSNGITFSLFKSYNICKPSGVLGPKYKSGDKQVPEGIYYIDRFNPVSSFWLSLGINYPNEADKLRSSYSNLGGDIFIHGDCKTIGCLPMTDDLMNEIYLLAVLAKDNGQENIPVHLFPYQFSALKNAIYHSLNRTHVSLWKSLERIYTDFNSNYKMRQISVKDDGTYFFNF